MLTADPRLHERAVRMHDLGQLRDFHAAQVPQPGPAFCGSQFRMAELTAAVALAQLRRLEEIRRHCRALTDRLRAQISPLPGLRFRHLPDPAGETGFETYFWVPTTELRDAFRSRLEAARIPCQQMTGTYAQYRRAYVATGLAHAPGASPFPRGGPWPAPGYRTEDFPRTEALIHRFVVLPVGIDHTPEDIDHMAAVVRAIHHDLGIGR